jgi:hypothetical protein
MIPLYATFRQPGLLNSVGGVIHRPDRFSAALWRSDLGTLLRRRAARARGGGAHRRLLALWRLSARHLAAVDPALASYGAIVFIVAWNDLLIPPILNNRAEFMTYRS